MKILKLMSGAEFLLEDDEAENVAREFGQGTTMMRLRAGDYVNLKSIEFIGEPPLIPFWNGYPLLKDGRSFMYEGRRWPVEPNEIKNIEYKPDPKYVALKQALVEKMKMLSDGQRNLAIEEVAADERRAKRGGGR
jgi:hypothetical protein